MIPKKGEMFNHWGLSQKTVFLNHGSFGATPVSVMEEQDRINEMRMNEPDKYEEYLDELESYGDFSA